MSVGETAEAAVSSSSAARESAMTSLEKFKKLVDELSAIQRHVAARERRLRALGQHSREVGSIVQTIGTLSSRTDLLALNASIESVRAGEHGRGFAIVADEVRALAEQSAQAVQDITSRIEQMQLETQESISVASVEHDQMNQVIQRVNSTLDVLSEISDAAANCATNVSEIFTANQQQLRVLQSIVMALEETSEFAKANRIQAEGVHWTAKTMGQVGNHLNSSLHMVRSTGGGGVTSTSTPVDQSGDSFTLENRQPTSTVVTA
jgi:methyl-accepting chemotaxis protein